MAFVRKNSSSQEEFSKISHTEWQHIFIISIISDIYFLKETIDKMWDIIIVYAI